MPNKRRKYSKRLSYDDKNIYIKPLLKKERAIKFADIKYYQREYKKSILNNDVDLWHWVVFLKNHEKVYVVHQRQKGYVGIPRRLKKLGIEKIDLEQTKGYGEVTHHPKYRAFIIIIASIVSFLLFIFLAGTLKLNPALILYGIVPTLIAFIYMVRRFSKYRILYDESKIILESDKMIKRIFHWEEISNIKMKTFYFFSHYLIFAGKQKFRVYYLMRGRKEFMKLLENTYVKSRDG